MTHTHTCDEPVKIGIFEGFCGAPANIHWGEKWYCKEHDPMERRAGCYFGLTAALQRIAEIGLGNNYGLNPFAIIAEMTQLAESALRKARE
jgi:hypothetical protein